MRIARAVALIFALMLAPWIEDRAPDASSSGDAAFATTRRGPGDRETMTRFGASLVGALHDGNDTDHTVGVTVDADGNPIGDAVTQPARSMVGFVQDCSGFPPTQSGTLCGARGAYLHGHYLYVAATQVDTVSVVDVYRPDMPTVAGSVTDAKVLKGVVATWMHRSGEYLIAVARGRRPEVSLFLFSYLHMYGAIGMTTSRLVRRASGTSRSSTFGGIGGEPTPRDGTWSARASCRTSPTAPRTPPAG